MNWVESCIRALRKEDLFQNGEHEELFCEAVLCYQDKPFFSSGLCKCIYLASWDMEHFTLFLEPINIMVARGDKNLDYMEELGKVIVDENKGVSERDRYLFELSGSFLQGEEFELPEEVETSGQDWVAIYHCAKRAAQIIEAHCPQK